jgi:tRNA dimethylallyltransferase
MLPSNTRRIVRALEVYELTGIPLSSLQAQKTRIDFTPLMIGLQWDRKALYERINRRVETMLQNGLLDEVSKLRNLGYAEETNSLQTVGYHEAFAHLRGKIDYDTMADQIKRNTRRYAKRQLTWFRGEKRIHWYPLSDDSELITIGSRVANLYRAHSQ